ncbi:MAG: hypothetical protein MJ198_05295 [Bacteroidales bacterium]|nr:hypothetical protein [Bacteroidales bacterium]
MNSPIVVIDARSPQKALENLSKHFTVVPFFSENITYDAIAGHPDIFICQGKTPIFAPNTPHNIIASIKNNTNETIIYGNNNIGKDLENSTFYNCVVTDSYIFHKKKVH